MSSRSNLEKGSLTLGKARRRLRAAVYEDYDDWTCAWYLRGNLAAITGQRDPEKAWQAVMPGRPVSLSKLDKAKQAFTTGFSEAGKH